MVKLENQLKDLILQNVEFVIDKKVIKKGKIKVFNTKQFFIRFKLETETESKEYELPYPYKTIKTPNGYMFDYCLSAFVPRTDELFWKMKTINKQDASRIHEKYLFISKLSS